MYKIVEKKTLLKLFLALLITVLPYHHSYAGSDNLDIKNIEGRASIKVTYLNPGEKNPAFDITVHSNTVNLRRYNIEELSLLRGYKGREYKGRWEATANRRRHKKGILTFQGVNLIKVKKIELVIKDIAGIKERRFNWQIK